MAEMTLEQQRAVAMARARLRLQNEGGAGESPPAQAKERTAAEEVARQLGLTGRYLIEGATGPFDLAATPIRAGLNLVAPGTFDRTGGEAIGDILGLPKPETDTEQSVGTVSRVLAGSGGMINAANALAPAASGVTKAVWQTLGSNPAVQLQSATGAGIGADIARQNEWGPIPTLIASTVGGLAAPASVKLGRMAAEPVKDLAATIHAAWGGDTPGGNWGQRRILMDAAEKGLGDAKDSVRTAAYNASDDISGPPVIEKAGPKQRFDSEARRSYGVPKRSNSAPTVGQAVAEYNLRNPGSVKGGWATRIEKDLSGAKGVVDELPSVYARQERAISDAVETLNVKTAPMRDTVIGAVNKAGGVDARRLASDMDTILSSVEGNKTQYRAVKLARSELDRLLGNTRTYESGNAIPKVDAGKLYEMRLSLKKVVEAGLGDSAKYDQKRVGWAVRQVQKAIDTAIEREAQGNGLSGLWKKYLATYEEGMKPITTRRAVVEKASEMAGAVKQTGGSAIANEAPSPPTLLNRPMMFANWFIKHLAADANDPTIKELTRRLQDPKAFAELLARPPTDTLRQRMLEAVTKGQAGMALAMQSRYQEQEQRK